MKKWLNKGIIGLFSLGLAACGFHLRSAEQLPPQLHELCVVTPKPSSSFTNKLISLFTSLQLKVNPSCPQAPYQFRVYSTSLTRDNPAITTADQALTFNYTYSVDLELTNKQGQALISRRTLSASRAVILNAQQVYTSYNTGAIQKQLEQIILSQIFEQLTTTQTKANFSKYPSH